ncbi:MAG: EF-P lysine aminoacylase GenX [Micavibrio sp.]|nr:EF-P lysine aminoacylase GenX [Micavibrio sp.]
MKYWLPHTFEERRPYLEARQRILKSTRGFFEGEGFAEVETPIVQTMPGADVHVHAFEVQGGQFLQNSPEFAMKKLLVAGCPKIYQICKVFRREIVTPRHSPEFTMLEWYRAGVGYQSMMDDCIALLRACADTYTHNGITCDPHKEWQRITVAEAFKNYAGIDLADHLQAFSAAARSIGVRTTPSDNWDDIFHAVMAEKIEPYLGQGAPTILYEYPAHMACLARKKPDDPQVAERFELYVCGIELANAFSELTDAAEQRLRFTADMEEKQRIYGERFPLDEDFLAALEHGMPESAGIALGFDRLVMLASGAEDINQVLWCG